MATVPEPALHMISIQDRFFYSFFQIIREEDSDDEWKKKHCKQQRYADEVDGDVAA